MVEALECCGSHPPHGEGEEVLRSVLKKRQPQSLTRHLRGVHPPPITRRNPRSEKRREGVHPPPITRRNPRSEKRQRGGRDHPRKYTVVVLLECCGEQPARGAPAQYSRRTTTKSRSSRTSMLNQWTYAVNTTASPVPSAHRERGEGGRRGDHPRK